MAPLRIKKKIDRPSEIVQGFLDFVTYQDKNTGLGLSNDFLNQTKAKFSCPSWTDRQLNVSLKKIFVFHLNWMKIGEVLAHIDNSTNFHLIQIKNKKVFFNNTFNGQSVH